jgi:hypothetical protein
LNEFPVKSTVYTRTPRGSFARPCTMAAAETGTPV